MIEPSGITIQVDGESVDLADVSWLEVAPCGCGSGCLVAYLPPPYSMVHATPDQAADHYYDNAANRAQAERRGFKIIPIHRKSLVEQLNTKCTHIPTWGYERPTPDGLGWAVAKWGNGRVLHLVSTDSIDPENGTSRARPLCKAPENYGWSDKFRGAQPDCEKCIKAASVQGVLV